jgi:hypothetical protein
MEKQNSNVFPSSSNVSPPSIPSPLDLLKTIGVVVGGLGSVAGGSAALFYWIGNTVIVSRLREYNLYGIVHYTDEYVKEAGYQFIQDIFACFKHLDLVFLSVGIFTLTLFLLPIGPFSKGDKIWDKTWKPSVPSNVTRVWQKKILNILISILEFLWIRLKFMLRLLLWIRYSNLHYFLFVLLAGGVSIFLLTNYTERRLSNSIVEQTQILSNTLESLEKDILSFVEKDHGEPSIFQQTFYNDLEMSVSWLRKEKPRDWFCQSLSELGFPCSLKDNSLHHAVETYQKSKGIHESPDFKFNGDFEKSETNKILLKDLIIKKMKSRLANAVNDVLTHLRVWLAGHLTGESEDAFTVFVINPSIYRSINDLIRKLLKLQKNIDFFFKTDKKSEKIMVSLGKIKEISVGSHILSCSFWVFIGLLVYLIINIPKILHFKHWEQGYFLILLLISLSIAINLPTAYGRYIFEFKIQKINKIIFSEEKKGEGKEEKGEKGKKTPLQEEMDQFFADKEKELYILGPTKGKEIIVGAITNIDRNYGIPQIIMLDRETYKYINVQPVEDKRIPYIVMTLRGKNRILKGR